MTILLQIMMGISLAACAGLRAWLPLLVVGILAKTGYIQLSQSFAFLSNTKLLVVFAIATIIECLGDKIIAVDHLLDAFGTILRPVAGTVLAIAVMAGLDPIVASTVGVIIGGGTALTIHSGKTVLRAKSTMFAAFHGGTANAALSFAEDFSAIVGLAISIFVPIVAFIITIIAIAIASFLTISLVKKGIKLFDFLKNRNNYNFSK